LSRVYCGWWDCAGIDFEKEDITRYDATELTYDTDESVSAGHLSRFVRQNENDKGTDGRLFVDLSIVNPQSLFYHPAMDAVFLSFWLI
jgi:hypothetical protein